MEEHHGESGLRPLGTEEQIEPALDELARRLIPQLEAYVSRRLPPTSRRWIEPADIVQQALQENLASSAVLELDDDEVLRRLFRTANLRMLDELRRCTPRVGESVQPAGVERARDPEGSEGAVTRADSRVWLRELIARLPAEYAQVLQLCSIEGLSFTEAGARLGLLPDTVRKRFTKARDSLLRASKARTGDPQH